MAVDSKKNAKSISQASVVPYRVGADGVEFCLITSRRSGRWGFPKGHVRELETPYAAALNEAWEEAGLIGTIIGERLGTYRYTKKSMECEVLVLLMEVATCHDDWKESHQRRRSWAVPEEALQLLTRPNLIHLLQRAIERVTPSLDSKRRSAVGA